MYQFVIVLKDLLVIRSLAVKNVSHNTNNGIFQFGSDFICFSQSSSLVTELSV